MTLIYLDTETTGLDPDRHEVWEISYAVGDAEIQQSFVEHTLENAEPIALEIGRYHERFPTDFNLAEADKFESDLIEKLADVTVVGANPAFDAKMLSKRWGVEPWHYRLLDIESYAMPYFGWEKPKGMKAIYDALTEEGFVIPTPDHTAAGDVRALREVHKILQERYAHIKDCVWAYENLCD
jgi:DNA polymerase III epsilon subunit-like protein